MELPRLTAPTAPRSLQWLPPPGRLDHAVDAELVADGSGVVPHCVDAQTQFASSFLVAATTGDATENLVLPCREAIFVHNPVMLDVPSLKTIA